METMEQATRGACCGNPKPRILETNGRLFCGNCRKYLDKRDEPTQPPLPETPTAKVVKTE